jgi:hypothetical protein
MTHLVTNPNNSTCKEGIKTINIKEELHLETTLIEKGRTTHPKNLSSRIKILIMTQCSSSTTILLLSKSTKFRLIEVIKGKTSWVITYLSHLHSGTTEEIRIIITLKDQTQSYKSIIRILSKIGQIIINTHQLALTTETMMLRTVISLAEVGTITNQKL